MFRPWKVNYRGHFPIQWWENIKKRKYVRNQINSMKIKQNQDSTLEF